MQGFHSISEAAYDARQSRITPDDNASNMRCWHSSLRVIHFSRTVLRVTTIEGNSEKAVKSPIDFARQRLRRAISAGQLIRLAQLPSRTEVSSFSLQGFGVNCASALKLKIWNH